VKLKGFCTTKEMVSKLKKLQAEWKRIFSSCTADKGLITRIYRELKKLNSPKKINDQMKKWTNKLANKSKWLKIHEKMLTITGHKCKSKPH
jgi:hypothetical protein